MRQRLKRESTCSSAEKFWIARRAWSASWHPPNTAARYGMQRKWPLRLPKQCRHQRLCLRPLRNRSRSSSSSSHHVTPRHHSQRAHLQLLCRVWSKLTDVCVRALPRRQRPPQRKALLGTGCRLPHQQSRQLQQLLRLLYPRACLRCCDELKGTVCLLDSRTGTYGRPAQLQRPCCTMVTALAKLNLDKAHVRCECR